MSSPPTTLHSIWQQIANNTHADFLVTNDRSFSYRALYQEIRRTCAQFDANQVGQNSRILIVSDNEFVAASSFIAALLDGHIPVMLSHEISSERANAIFDSVEPAMVVADKERITERWASSAFVTSDLSERKPAHRAGQLFAPFSRLRSKSQTELGIQENSRDPSLPAELDSLAYILFTSGTTSTPNGVQITRNNLMRHLDTLIRLFDYSHQSRICNATPMAHTDGLVQGPLLAVASGAALIRPGAFSVSGIEDWLHSFRRLRATHFITNPTVLALLDRYASHSDYFDSPEFRAILSSAAILRPELWTRIQDRFGCPLFNLYGMTETVANATYAGDHPEFGPVGTIGFPIDCEARLGSHDGKPLAPGADRTGELQLRGENIFSGYWRNPVRTAETFAMDGWMRTGDFARKREDGSYEILGRLKTAINSGGTLIRPEEIDEVLLNHPAISESVTVGLPDPVFDEIPVSAVVLDVGQVAVDEGSLTAHCRACLERLKVPKRIVIVDAIPRGDSGKPKLDELKGVLEKLLKGHAKEAVENLSNTIEEKVIFEAAKVFRVAPTTLNLDSSPQTVKGWDSFTQINLILVIEEAFNLRFKAATVSGIRKIADVIDAVVAQQAQLR